MNSQTLKRCHFVNIWPILMKLDAKCKYVSRSVFCRPPWAQKRPASLTEIALKFVSGWVGGWVGECVSWVSESVWLCIYVCLCVCARILYSQLSSTTSKWWSSSCRNHFHSFFSNSRAKLWNAAISLIFGRFWWNKMQNVSTSRDLSFAGLYGPKSALLH